MGYDFYCHSLVFPAYRHKNVTFHRLYCANDLATL